MASAIGAALISTILEPMAAKAMEKVKAMVVDKVDGIVNIERDIAELQITLRMIQGIVQVAEEKQIDDVCIRNWLRGVVDVAYEARDVLDDFITFSSCIITAEEASKPVNFISSHMLSCFCGSSSDTSNIPLAILNRLEKDIRSVRKRFDEKKDGETFKTLISVAGGGSESIREYCIPIVGPSINKQGDGLFLGREEVKQGIMEKILHPSDDNRVHVVVIWGMGGIGKTTLARSIYNDENVKKVPRRWLCVGESKFSAAKVIREIVNDQNTAGIGNLDAKLQKELSGDRFLIVLDDVWDVDGNEWNLLFNPLTHVGKGGLIIITKRERELCAAITIQTAYNLELLSEQDSWSIFKSCAFIDGNSDSRPDLKCIGKKNIVKKLNGLPLALEVVGSSLLNKDSSTWTDFLESKFPKDDEVMSVLRWSYNHLPRHLKTCFTYFSLFPKDHVLDKKVLVEMWMVHDLIQKEEQERPEDVGAHYFEQLVNASLLQCFDGKYTMHDLIHDLALLVSNGEFATTDDSLPIGQMDKVRHVTITRGDYSEIPRLCKIEKLLTLYTIWSDEEDKHHHAVHNMQDSTFILDEIYPTEKYDDSVLDDVFKQLKSIRVLVLVSSKITHIPDCISELKHLQYLDVRETEVKRLPDSLCHLYNLQMLAAPLDAAMPRDIVNMRSLKYLRANLSTCKGVGKLTSLQELSSIHVCEGDNIREIGDMQRLRGKLTIKDLENVEKLEDTAALMEKQTLMDELELVFNQHFAESIISDEEVLDALGCPPNLTYLRIAGYNGLKPPSWMVDGNHKFDKLQTLELYDFPKLESLPPLGEFDKLQTLQLSDCPKLESLPPLGEFDKLQTLQLFGCPKLQSLPPLEEFDKLQTLQLSDCPKLKSLPPLGELTSLKHLSLRNVGVKRLGYEFYGKFIDTKVFFPSLESLRFYKMQEWEKWDDIIIENSTVSFFPSLTTLKIERCAKIVSVSPTVSNAADFMKSLSSLKIDECPKLISCLPVVKKWEDDEHPIMNAANFMASVSSLKIRNCDGLKRLQLDALVSLKELEISNCSSLVQITSAICESLEISSCRLLEKMDVARCDSLVVIKILKLEVEDCESLRSLSIDIHGLDSLERLDITGCPKLELAFEDGSSYSSSSGNSVAVPLHFIRTDNTQVFRTLLHHELVSLESLDITNLEGFENFGDNFCKSRLLKSLHIWQCKDLKSLPVDFHKLSSLKSLSIFYSPKLQSLPPDFYKLSSLENLDINSCPLFQSLPPDFHKLSSLKSLSIIHCPQLQSLPPDFHKLSSLEELHIESCPQLQSLPPDFHKLSSLDKLYIFSCPLLYERCKDESGLDWHNIKHIRRKWISEI